MSHPKDGAGCGPALIILLLLMFIAGMAGYVIGRDMCQADPWACLYAQKEINR